MSELVYNNVNHTNYSSDIQKLKDIKTLSIVSIVLACTLIFILVSIVIDIVLAIKILTTNWSHKEVEDQKIIWGVFTLVLLGSISSLIFSVGGLNKMK